MQLDRRTFLVSGLAAGGALLLAPGAAQAMVDEAVAAFTGGADVAEATDLTLTAPEIAENGNTVPIEVSAPGATAIMVLAAGNPNPAVGTFKFGPLAASQFASTRIRLAGTQDVVAIAQMADGSFQRVSREVKVTIGGCGG